jgi:proline dehydrogenase
MGPGVDGEQLEAATQAVGRQIAAAFPSASRNPLRAIDSRAMELAASDRELKAALFRFVDVAPACHSLDDLARHLVGFLTEVEDAPKPVSAAVRLGGTKPGRAALGATAAAGVRHMAHRFIVGETLASASNVLSDLWEHGVASTVDLLGEATVTPAEADAYALRRYRSCLLARRAGRRAPHSSETASERSRGPTCRSRCRR